MKLQETNFGSVRLGAVFFDPASGHKYQKVDEPNVKGWGNKYGNSNNAVGSDAQKNFERTDTVKALKAGIKTTPTIE